MTERMVCAGGLELATEIFDDAARPPVLLIMGGMASMLWWPDAFCERLAGQGRCVIRYDNRDTGRSTKYPPGKPRYTFDDMVDDVFRILDGYAVPATHIVGMSLGGMIGQAAAIKQPSRVLSLTAISSSPMGTDTSHLPSFSKSSWSTWTRGTR
jgi:pimeloyl-ACP methyl ester carboxylesterase